MTENAIKLMRNTLASRWWYFLALWSWRGLITELLEAYEKAEAKAHAAEQDRFSAQVRAEALQLEINQLREAHNQTRRGNEVLRKFIELNHKPMPIAAPKPTLARK